MYRRFCKPVVSARIFLALLLVLLHRHLKIIRIDLHETRKPFQDNVNSFLISGLFSVLCILFKNNDFVSNEVLVT